MNEAEARSGKPAAASPVRIPSFRRKPESRSSARRRVPGLRRQDDPETATTHSIAPSMSAGRSHERSGSPSSQFWYESRHSGESRNPDVWREDWFPAFAGKTTLNRQRRMRLPPPKSAGRSREHVFLRRFSFVVCLPSPPAPLPAGEGSRWRPSSGIFAVAAQPAVPPGASRYNGASNNGGRHG